MVLSSSDWRASKLFISIVINLAIFTDAYFYGVIIPVLPFALTEVVHVNESDVQWWIGVLLAAYGAGLLVGAPIIGYYADRSDSRRVPYLAGLVFLAISTVAISVGRTMVVLVAGRLIQGLSSASVHAVGLAILADTAGDDGVGPAMGLVTTMMSLGAVLGPMVGGLLYHHFGYSAVFLSTYILVTVDFIFRLLMVEKTQDKGESTSTPEADSYGTFGNNSVSTDPTQEIIAPNTAPTDQLSNGDIHDVNTRNPIFPIISLLISPRMLAAILCDFIQSLVLTGLEAILPLRIKTVFSYNSQEVAFVFLILALPYAAGPLTGKIADVYGAKVVISCGFASLMPLIISLRLVDHYETEQVALLSILLFGTGTALNMVLTPAWSDTMYLVDAKSKEEPDVFGEKGAYAQAFGLMNMAYAVGSVLGPLMGGWLMSVVGWDSLTLGTGILCGVCVIPCLLYTGGKLPQKTQVC